MAIKPLASRLLFERAKGKVCLTIARFGVACLFTLLTVGRLAAEDEERGVIFYERFLGSQPQHGPGNSRLDQSLRPIVF
jgi:hypothetical protein